MGSNIKKSVYLIVIAAITGFACAPTDDLDRSIQATSSGSSRLSELLRAEGTEAYPRAIEQRDFDFPADHGPHAAYRNEWWYFTGNLDSDAGERFGFELTVFRFALTPELSVAPGSAWTTNQVYIAHFAVTDVARQHFHVAQRYSRGGVGLAGASAVPFRVWLDDWSITQASSSDAWRIRAGDDDLSLELVLRPEKPIVLNGDEGLSRKSAEVGNASYYYSIPRLSAEGALAIGDEQHDLTGRVWLDREWGSSALAANQQGWDWFALQLSDGSDLMFYTLRGVDGKPDVFSSGTWIAPDGSSESLSLEDVSIVVTDYWDSERGGRYPSAWEIDIPGRLLSLSVEPVLANQELNTNVRYWEGAVDVVGTSDGNDIEGRGYVELTGYADL